MSRNPRREVSEHRKDSDVVEQLLLKSLDDEGGTTSKRPWSIKGIDEATVQLCKLAARGKGMKINRWVADALGNAAQHQLGRTREPAQFDLCKLLEQNERLSERVSRLEGELNALARSQAVFLTALSNR